MQFYILKTLITIFIITLEIGSVGATDKIQYHSLFNGRDLFGWTTTGNWTVEPGGILTIKPRPGEKGWQRYADYLWTDKVYDNFTLELEYKIPKDGNSGIFFGVKNKNNPVYERFEIQILDSHNKTETLTAHDCGGLIGIQAPKKNAAKPFGQWNRMTIVCQGNHLRVKLNGEQILDLDVSTKIARDKPFSGYIGLQDHGLPLEFRNIRIK